MSTVYICNPRMSGIENLLSFGNVMYSDIGNAFGCSRIENMSVDLDFLILIAMRSCC